MSPFGILAGFGVCGFLLFAGISTLVYFGSLAAQEKITSTPVLTSEIAFSQPTVTTVFKDQSRLNRGCQ